jgi:hypothetical protein
MRREEEIIQTPNRLEYVQYPSVDLQARLCKNLAVISQ